MQTPAEALVRERQRETQVTVDRSAGVQMFNHFERLPANLQRFLIPAELLKMPGDRLHTVRKRAPHRAILVMSLHPRFSNIAGPGLPIERSL